MRIENRGIEGARLLDETVVETALQVQARFGIGIDGNAALGDEEHPPEVVNAMRVVGVCMGVEDGIDMLDAGGEQLLAQVGGGVDQPGRSPILAEPFDQQRASPPPVLWVGGIAVAPDIADARHAPGRAAAQDRKAHAHAARAVRGVLAYSRKKLSVVARPIGASETPLTLASSFAVSTT